MKTTLLTFIALLPLLAIAERPINELPMYGGQHEPIVELNSNISKDAAMRGWRAYYEGDSDKAMRRFNQAWMFDRENPEVYWGFGLVMQKRAEKEETEYNLKEAIKLIEIAQSKAPADGRILGDLAFAHSILSFELGSEGKSHAMKASQLFERAYELTPDYPPIVAHWSMHYFYIKNFEKAKAKADEAQNSGFKFDPAYLTDLKHSLDANQSE